MKLNRMIHLNLKKQISNKKLNEKTGCFKQPVFYMHRYENVTC